MSDIQLLTFSRMNSFKRCRNAEKFEYEWKVRRTTDPKALRMGSAHHTGLEVLHNGGTVDDAVDAVHASYMHQPEFIDQLEWLYERETCVRMVCGYHWRWEASGIKYLAAEMPFKFPLVNPATGAKSKTFALAGKIDGIVQLEDGRLAVLESKLLGDDISQESSLWRRMRMDHQITTYVLGARQLGYAVDTVLYDVARKPTIGPTQIPLLDELGTKVVLDSHGVRVKTDKGLWRQTGDKERGYVLQSRPMTADEWGEKLNNDIAERPDFYFQRIEIPRLDNAVAEYQRELWDIGLAVRQAQLKDAWYKTVGKNTCDYCSVMALCESNWQPGDSLPEGFVIVANQHPELETNPHVSTDKTVATAAYEAATAAADASYW